MTVLAWLAIPLGSLVLGMVYAAIAGRSRGPRQPTDTVQAYERFRTAMAAPAPATRQPTKASAASVPPAREATHHRKTLLRSR